MNCRPRRLFQEIGQRIGINWFKQPRAQMILVPETDLQRIEANVGDLHRGAERRTDSPEVWRRQ